MASKTNFPRFVYVATPLQGANVLESTAYRPVRCSHLTLPLTKLLASNYIDCPPLPSLGPSAPPPSMTLIPKTTTSVTSATITAEGSMHNDHCYPCQIIFIHWAGTCHQLRVHQSSSFKCQHLVALRFLMSCTSA